MTAGKSGWRRLIIRTPLDGPILILLVMIPVSIWATFDLGFSLPKIAGLILGIAIFYTTAAYINGVKRLIQVLVLFFLIGAGIATLGLVGTQWLRKNPWLSNITSRLPSLIRGLPGAESGFHPNEVAGVLLWFLPAQIALLTWLWRKGRLKTWEGSGLLVSTLLTALTLILTQSRGALLGLAIGLTAMGAWLGRRARIVAGLLLLTVLLAVAVKGPAWIDEVLYKGIAPDVLGKSNWSFRLEVWRVALWGIRDFPFTGMGLGTFRRIARVLYPLDVVPTYDIAHAHNGFLQAAVDLGMPGLVAYSFIWLTTARLIISSATLARGWLRALAIGLAGCWVSSFVYNLTDTIALGAKGGLAWWMMLGLIVGLFRLCCVIKKAPVKTGKGAEWSAQ